MNVLDVLEGQIDGLEKASADCTTIDERIKVADAIIRLVNTESRYLNQKALVENLKDSNIPGLKTLAHLACEPPGWNS